MGKRLTGLAAALMLSATGAIAAEQNYGTSKVTITRDGAPAANVTVHVQPLNGASAVVGTTGAAGELAFALSLVNKPEARFQIVVYDCRNGEQIVVLAEAGAEAPEKDDCRKTILAVLRMRAGSTAVIDLARLTAHATGTGSFLRTRNGQLAAGAAAIGALALIATTGGNDSTTDQDNETPAAFNVSGDYPAILTPTSDPGGHLEFLEIPRNITIAVDVTGSTARLTFPPGSNLPAMIGTVSSTAGQVTITAEGRGSAAGRSNVLHRAVVTIITAAGANQGLLSGSVTVGAGGELPGGQPTVLTAAGRKQ